ncbi:MAG: hypothetical protein JWQ89_285 [Devosia sp.]|uniref:hypothetical protein n=1 Tax=Devosia sp. TaxID=1871048 RepID=UPI002625828B|nr:hypothetical protein [Devosia sp.]MDB5538558.1 hypothetical protein [Devosia sp.]
MSRLVCGALAALLWPAAPALSDPIVLDADQLVVEATVPFSGDFLAPGFDAIWMMRPFGKLVRADPADNSGIQHDVPGAVGAFARLAVGEGGIWIPDSANGGHIYKFDPVTATVALDIPVNLTDPEGCIAVGGGSVWAVGFEDRHIWLRRYSATTGEEQSKTAIAGGVCVAIGEGSVWVSDTYHDAVLRLDLGSGELLATIPVAGQPRFLAVGEEAVWVITQMDGLVHRIDPASNTLTASISTGHRGSGGDITTGGGFVWASFRGAPVVRINPLSHDIRVYEGVGFGDAIAYGSGSVWVSGQRLSRITPPVP